MHVPDGLARRLVRAVARGVLFGVPVVALAFAVRTRFDPVLHLDEAAIRRATGFTRNHPDLRTGWVFWQEAFQPLKVYSAATLLCGYAWFRHGFRSRAAWAFTTMMVTWFLALQLKLLVQRARPVVEDAVAHAPGYSFPSGHAANTSAAVSVLLLLFWPIWSSRQRHWVLAAAVVIIAVTALDRVMLGVHYPSDVIAGSFFGIGLAVASYTGYLDWNPELEDSVGTR